MIIGVYVGGAISFLVFLLAGSSIAGLWLGIFLMGLFSFAESPQLQALLADVADPTIRDTSFALYFTLAFGVGSLWTWLYGEITGDGGVQVREIFRSLKGILQQSGSDFDHLVKATYYVSNDEASNKLNEIRPQFYKPDRPPAASKAKVRGVGMLEKTVTMDIIAATK